jgi:hypothetical protein
MRGDATAVAVRLKYGGKRNYDDVISFSNRALIGSGNCFFVLFFCSVRDGDTDSTPKTISF